MVIPPLLQDHVNELTKQGYNIEVIDETEICIVFHDYPIPDNIWDRDTADLLIVTHPTYPNSKLDMFWIDPPLSLKNGVPAKAVSMDTKYGKNWQRFSWHIQNWNPASDNIITYLDVVDDRLGRNQ